MIIPVSLAEPGDMTSIWRLVNSTNEDYNHDSISGGVETYKKFWENGVRNETAAADGCIGRVLEQFGLFE